ncbi:uncharacterized protein GIQ15_03642 [Arthroderma uncinatum]|uniref:uncharacterized protein n=1 Tax=Arthroderma uncinatum TaxID=74035 RepID=UPI00144A862E|nr:uncharacterized protein GIQ15_03642 [Arthroderma uncinatum]KAF3484318.1 hypothetical protein GIQ15_03642 [Arthroderma uncinatum]
MFVAAMPSQGGLINTIALAVQYDRALQDPNEDSTTGLWDRLLNNNFGGDNWIVTPQKRQTSGARPDFVIERFWSNSAFIEVIVVEAKPQHQTMSQDSYTDEQVLGYAINALETGQAKGQMKIFALRVVGTRMMAYKVTRANQVLTPLASDYMDPKVNEAAMRQVFDMIKNANVLAP